MKRVASGIAPVLRKGKDWAYHKVHYFFIAFFALVLLAFTIWLITIFY